MHDFGLMASSSEKCSFCHHDTMTPRNGWCLKDHTYAKLCPRCSNAFEDGTFCHLYHQHEDGWRKCDDCESIVHCGCIMALRTFEVNDSSGVTCKECIKKKSLVVSDIGASSVPNIKDCLQLEDCSSSTDIFATNFHAGEECLADPGKSKPLNYDVHNPDQATIEGNLEISQLYPSEPISDLVFLFEKKLTPTDCDIRAGRLLVPKLCAEKFLPQVPGQHRVPLSIEDTEGLSWQFILRWWLNRKSRKYVLDGTRKCVETMQWNVGDTLKFYRKHSDGTLIMKLEKTHATSSGSGAAVPGDDEIHQS